MSWKIWTESQTGVGAATTDPIFALSESQKERRKRVGFKSIQINKDETTSSWAEDINAQV